MDRKDRGIVLYNEHLLARDAGNEGLAQAKLKESARLGEVMAKHAIAYNTINGSRGETLRALRLYRDAANRGFAPSAVNLARYYEEKCKKRLYFQWLHRASELGDPDARAEIAFPAPYLFEVALKKIKVGERDEGEVMLRAAARWGNLEAEEEISARTKKAQ